MTLRGYPFLLNQPQLCDVFGISRWTLRERLIKKAYPFLEKVDDNGTVKFVKPSVERQLEAMRVKS